MKQEILLLRLRSLLFLAGSLCYGLSSYADNPYKNCDFTVDGVFYDITSSSTVAVTYKTFRKDSSYDFYYPVSGFSGDVVIPSKVTYNSRVYDVTAVGANAFKESAVTSVTLPSSILSIGSDAFYDCRQLASVILPESIETIGSSAFNGCTSLSDIYLPDGLAEIGNGCFYGCSRLSSVVLPGSLSNVSNQAFCGCSGLTSVIFLNGIATIGSYAFAGCTSLTYINIPSSVTSISDYAFNYCDNLRTVNVQGGVTDIGYGAFGETAWYNNQPDGLVYVGQVAYKYKGTMPADTRIALREGTTGIAASTFSGCTGLTSVTMPSSVVTIGTNAFAGCTGLTSVIIPSSVSSLGAKAFYGCSSLSSVNIGNGNMDIGASAFYNCASLTSATNLGSIGYAAFAGCTSLTNVTLSAYAESIDSYAFSGCTSLVSVSIKEGLARINDSAFKNCSALRTLNIPGSVESIYWTAFDGCSAIRSVTLNCKTVGTWFSGRSSLQEVVMGEGVTEIAGRAFYNCSSLIAVTIPSSVTSIGSDAFLGTPWYDAMPEGLVYIGNTAYKYKGTMPANTDIELKEGTVSIAPYTFRDCSGLRSITIPQSTTDISVNSAFYGCGNLESIIIDGSNPKYDSRQNCNAIIEKETNTLLMGCKGSFIPDGVTAIEASAFAGCTGLKSITIPNSVTSIGQSAFSGCTGLTFVSLPNSVTTINWGTFQNCTGLTSVTIPDGVTSIDDGAFHECQNLASISFPDGITRIGANAFYNTAWLNSQPNGVVYAGTLAYKYKGTMDNNTQIYLREGTTGINESLFSIYGCERLTFVSIPGSVRTIGPMAFYKCTGLTSVSIPYGVTAIGYSAFEGCTNLLSLSIPNSVTEIGGTAFKNTAWYNSQPNGVVYAGRLVYKYKGTMPNGMTIAIEEGTTGIVESAFQDCAGLTSVSFPSSLAAIGINAFYGCTGLSTISIPKRVTSIGDNAFNGCNHLRSVTMGNPVPVNISSSYTFSNSAKATLYVPTGSKSAYASADYWKDFMEIISTAVPGDANGDGEVNVADIVEMVNAIMEQPSERFVREAADVNGDGEVNVTDIVLIVSMIMDDSNGTRSAKSSSAGTTDDDVLTVGPDGTNGLSLRLTNAGAYVAAQFDLHLDEGQTLEDITLSGLRESGHEVVYRQTGKDTWRVLVYSLGNEAFPNDGGLIDIRVNGTAGAVTIDGILFVTDQFVEKRFKPIGGQTLGVTPVLTDGERSKGEVYDLLGRRMDSSTMKNGIRIVNGKKILK